MSFNEFGEQIMVSGLASCGPTLDDAGLRRILFEIEERFGWLPDKGLLWDKLLDLAKLNAFHPVRDDLERLSWDGTPRVDSWLVEYCNTEDTDYVRAVAAITLVGAVRRVRQPGCKFDTMLILEGPQGAGKSSVCHILADGIVTLTGRGGPDQCDRRRHAADVA